MTTRLHDRGIVDRRPNGLGRSTTGHRARGDVIPRQCATDDNASDHDQNQQEDEPESAKDPHDEVHRGTI